MQLKPMVRHVRSALAQMEMQFRAEAYRRAALPIHKRVAESLGRRFSRSKSA